jgi:hypothetical protein
MSMNTDGPCRLSDGALEAEVLRLARSERDSTASLVAHLAELYGRRLHERAGFSSLYAYCLEVLRLTEHEAYDRMKAAKVVRRFPHVLGGMVSGELNLTTIRLLAPHLSRDNERDLFAAARGKRKRQVLELLAWRFPKPDVASSVRRLAARRMLPVAAMPSAVLNTTAGTPAAAVNPPLETRARVPVPASPPPVVRPLAPERHQFTFTASTQAREMFELARDLLRHSIPSGDPARSSRGRSSCWSRTS